MIVRQNSDTLVIKSEGAPEEFELLNFIFDSIENGTLYEICNGPKHRAMVAEVKKMVAEASQQATEQSTAPDRPTVGG